MPDSTVLQEFLVSLGFKLDDAQRQKFDQVMTTNRAQADALNKSLAGATQQMQAFGNQLGNLAGDPYRKASEASSRLTSHVQRLGITATATATAFVTGFAAIAKQYDELYYTAQRSGVSTGQVSAMNFAGGQVGNLSIAQAQQAFSTAQQVNPGVAGLMRQWGVRSLDDFERRIKDMPDFLKAAYSQMVGLSFQFSRDYTNNIAAINAAMDEHLARLRAAGVETDKVFGDPTRGKIGEVGQAVRDLNTIWDQLNVAMIKGFDEAYPYMDKLLKGIIALGAANLEFIGQHPGAALAESLAAAYASAVGLLKILSLLPGGSAAGAAARALGPSALAGAATSAVPGYLAGDAVADYLKNHPESNLREPGAYRSGMTAGQMLRLPPPGYATGGVVGHTGMALVHAGEVVVPTQQGGDFLNFLRTLTTSLAGWLSGSSAYRPLVQVYGLSPGAPVSSGGAGVVQANYSPGGMGMVGQMGPGGMMVRPSGGASAAYYGSGTVSGPVASQIVATLRASGASEAVIQGVVAAALGEGGVSEAWRQSGIVKNGVREESFGPWQLHKGSRLDSYLAGGNKPGDVEAQTKYVLDTMEHLVPGFSKLKDATRVVGLMHDVFLDYGASAADLGRAAQVVGSVGGSKVAGEPAWMGDPTRPMLRGFDTGLQKGALDRFKASLRGSNATLGGTYSHTVNNDAGDRHVAMNQVNNIHVTGDTTAGRRIASEVNRNAGWMTANAHTALS